MIFEGGSVRVVYEDSSCLARKVAVVSDMCMHMLHVHAHAHCDVWAGAALADLLSVCCIFLCIESCCIRPKIAV